MKYEYAELGENERQYDGIDLTKNRVVEAVYVRSPLSCDHGNAYIECLPAARTREEVHDTYHRPILDYSWEQRKWPDFDRMKAIMQLRDVRFVLPFHMALEQEFGLALLNSYRHRNIHETYGALVTISDQKSNANYSSEKKLGAAINAGVALLGYSGCGKTSAIGTLLSNYPQVVIHHDEDGNQYTQIVYLYVVCVANSNFKALYQSVGRAIDRALGNTTPVYETVINQRKSIGEKTNKICDLIDLFGIGAIIFDEVQLMDFDGTHENSFSSLMNIVNNTQVALILVGTEEAYSKMLPKLQIARRAGARIAASKYCSSKDTFTLLCEQLFRYQWFDTHVEFTDDDVDTLYRLTYGIVDQLVSLYIYMHIYYVRSESKPTVNSDYISYISKKFFPGMQILLEQLKTGSISESDFERKSKEIRSDADRKLEIEMEDLRVQQATMQIAQDVQDKQSRNYDQLLRNVVQNIRNTIQFTGEEYSDDEIVKDVNRILRLKKNLSADEKQITQQTYQLLKRKPSETKPKGKRAVMDDVHIHMRNFLEQSG